MKIDGQLTDTAVLQELGARLARLRIEAALTQAALAEQAGISKRTLERIEAGRSAELVTLIRLLRALKLADALNAVVPESPPSPMAQLRQQGRQRQRAARVRSSEGAASGKPWTWRQ